MAPLCAEACPLSTPSVPHFGPAVAEVQSLRSPLLVFLFCAYVLSGHCFGSSSINDDEFFCWSKHYS